jgi:hypothetical protein
VTTSTIRVNNNGVAWQSNNQNDWLMGSQLTAAPPQEAAEYEEDEEATQVGVRRQRDEFGTAESSVIIYGNG